MKLFEFTKNKIFSFRLSYRKFNKNLYFIALGFCGSSILKCNERVFQIIRSQIYMHLDGLKALKWYLIYMFFGISFFWSISYEIVGYNYTVKSRLRKRLFRLNLGYSRHKILLYLPISIKVISRKRKFWVFSTDINILYSLAVYIRDLRNLLPYKLKGLISNSNWKKFLKPGKVTKYR